jgi:hypothetical protein
MKNETKPSQSLAELGQYRELIKQLARQQFIREKMGTEKDFEKLWRDAFGENGTIPVLPFISK